MGPLFGDRNLNARGALGAVGNMLVIRELHGQSVHPWRKINFILCLTLAVVNVLVVLGNNRSVSDRGRVDDQVMMS